MKSASCSFQMSHQIKVWETKKKVKIPEYKLAFRIAYEATPILSL